jgi:hypothetical protein
VNDPANCGACGHGCLGGACFTQACQPATLAGGQSFPNGIAVDATSTYWSDIATGNHDGSIMKCAIADCPGTLTTLASNIYFVGGVAVDATNVYWASMDGVFRCAIAGCGGTPTLLSNVVNALTTGPIVVDATNAYWTKDSGGTVMQCPLGNCNAGLKVIASTQAAPLGIAVSVTDVYFTTFDAVMRVPIGGGAPVMVAPETGNRPWGITLDAANAYWALQGGAGGVHECTLGGCAAPKGLSTDSSSWSVVVDATNAYWTDFSGLVQRVPIGGGPTTQLWGGLGASIPYIAQDAASVYWTNKASAGSVMRLAK